MLLSALKWVKGKVVGLFPAKTDEKQKVKVISGQTPLHIVTNILLQIVLILVFVFGVEHEVFPKPSDVKDYPGLGEPGGPISVEAEPVMPFKRYPPGFDVFGCVRARARACMCVAINKDGMHASGARKNYHLSVCAQFASHSQCGVDRPQPDGTKSARLREKVLEYQFKFFIEISTYVYLGFAVQYSFLRKFGYSTMSFGLLQATVAAQWGIIW